MGRDGRKETFAILQEKRNYDQKLVWFHAASLGEFEQGRPLLEKIRTQHPDYQILLTFFSPSGFEIRKNYPLADIVCYLPLDSMKNAKQFLELARPNQVFFIKYEFWFNFLKELTDKKIPTYYIAAIFRPNQYFFKWYGRFLQPFLKKITHYFVQNDTSKKQLERIGIGQVSVVGDPRIDRVSEIAKKPNLYPTIADFCGQKPVLIIGSSWEKDEAILMPFINENTDWKFIIAPHEIHENHLQSIENQCIKKIIRFSNLEKNSAADVLLIDNIGMLSSLYQFGKIAYIGGGFGAGIHNTLEPMAYNLPVIFGTNYQKFEEANAMISAGGAFSITSKEDFGTIFKQLEIAENWKAASLQIQRYINENVGATDKILDHLKLIKSR